MAQTVKRLSAMQETQVRSLGWEDPLQKGMAANSSTLAWGIPWTEEPGGLETMGSQSVRYDLATSLSLFFQCKIKPTRGRKKEILTLRPSLLPGSHSAHCLEEDKRRT